MWELYAMWALISVFFLDYWSARGADAGTAAVRAGLAAFAIIAAGGIGSVLAGRRADRHGRLTAFAIAGTSLIRDLAGWGIAFSLLAAGPALGIAALRRLQRLRRDHVPA
jgi:MFS family permease